MNYTRLETPEEVLSLIGYHNERSQFVVLDTETTSQYPRQAELLEVQVSGQHEDEVVLFSAEKAPLLTNLSKTLVIVAHNYKYDAHVLFRHGCDLLGHLWRDTLLIGHLLDENRESYSLDSYVKEIWNDNYKEAFWAQYKTYTEAPADAAATYGCKDVWYTGRLYRSFEAQLASEGLPNSLVEHTHRLQDALLRTEIEGIQVDVAYLQELGVRLRQRIDALGPEMRGLVEDDIEILELEAWQKEIEKRKTDPGKARVPRPLFSFDSSKQLQGLLYSRLGLPTQYNDKTKAVSTDYSSLEKIKERHTLIPLIQENRELQKVYTAYVEGTLDRLDKERIYPEFRVAGTVTGRLSHRHPNLAQLPKQGGVRGLYVPDRGRVLISADYSQLEVVIEANLTGDQSLARMLENGESKHDLTARELGCSRDIAKTLNFALQYWCSHYKVAKLLGVSNDEGLRIWHRYWEIYRGAKALKAKTDSMVDRGIPIQTVFGRKRRFQQRPRQEWDSDYRQAYNSLIQGTGADITNRAFYIVSEELRKSGVGRALFSVHDELLIEVDESDWQGAQDFMLDQMEKVGVEIDLKIPLKAEGSGLMRRWED